MPLAFVHLSDIHFGQEKGGDVIIHDDVKDCLIDDAVAQVAEHVRGPVAGVIVTGDVAFAGKSEEYTNAGKWLDKLAAELGCKKTAVQMVPGNHDIDRDGISSGCKLMLDEILNEGEPKLDRYLAAEVDRESLYGRFRHYRPFAEAYNCPLDPHGRFASDRAFDLAPERKLRFIGLNSALICTANDLEGRLLLGARQRVLPRSAAGEELVVLCHHPLNWFMDSEDARRYLRKRARVFVSGHEHKPDLIVDTITAGCDLMMLASGATVPPKADDVFRYTYNVLIFDWDGDVDALVVKIIPRVWNDVEKEFELDKDMLNGRDQTFILGCPNFVRASAKIATPGPEKDKTEIVATSEPAAIAPAPLGVEAVAANFPEVLLRFFRDLTPMERLGVLIKLRALPQDWTDSLTHTIERRVVDNLAADGRLAELEAAIDEAQRQRTQNSGGA